MARLVFIKTAPYGSKSRKDFQYYADLAAQRISPPLLPEAEKHILEYVNGKDCKGIKLILSSPQKRAVQTARIIQRLFLPEIPVEINASLNEVLFSIDNAERTSYSSTTARAKFLHDFVNNTLLEQRHSIQERIKKIFSNNPRGAALLVTHTFLMKIIQTLIKYPDLFEKPPKIKRNFEINKRLFEYCDTLTLTDVEIRRAAKFI